MGRVRFIVIAALMATAAHAATYTTPLTVTVTDAVSGESFSVEADAGQGQANDLQLEIERLSLPGARALEVDLRDTRGEDRAVDLDVTLPGDLTGWTWHHDMRRSDQIGAASEFTETYYPLIVVTPPDGGEGVAMAVEPSQPVIYRLQGSAEGLTLNARIGLTPAGSGDLKSRAQVRVYLLPVAGEWDFRDALATYYELFPEAFERRAMDEGQWLFAFENTKLPNPAHYAYHEGGPAGWQYDEEHGIGTYPYTEVSSRTLHVHRLPTDRQDALQAFEEYRTRRELAVADWTMRNGTADDAVAHGGDRSFRCRKTDPGGWFGVMQDVMVDQQEAEPVTISGWLKAEDVSGEPGRDLSLYGDVLLQSGEWDFGEIARFDTGTHDWQRAEHVVDVDEPIRMVRLHCLFRHDYTGTVWFDDIAVTTASKPDENRVQNPGFEKVGADRDIEAIAAYHVEASDGEPVFFIRTDLSADVKPDTPMKLLRFCLNPNPYLEQQEGVEPPPGPKAIAKYERMIDGIPQLDGAYIDSVSAWATREMDFRREHFDAARHNFSYDPESKRVVAPGKYYTYDFLNELGNALHPDDRWVFTNIHNTMNTFLMYAVSDVPGIESSITNHERFSYIRSASYQKPAVLLNFLNLLGFEDRAKHDRHWRMAVLYGLYPSIGRRCDEAYEMYGDLYRRFMPSLKRISAAGWEPVPHARAEPEGPAMERFGNAPDSGLFITAYNEARDEYDGDLVLDAEALGIADGMLACDTTTGWTLRVEVEDGVARVDMPIRPGDVAVWQIGTPETIAATAREELEQITVDLRRTEAQMPEDPASRVRDLRARIIGMSGAEPPTLTRETVEGIVALHNDESVEATTWTGETPGQALLRALMLRSRVEGVQHAPVGMRSRIEAVGGEDTRVKIYSGGEAVVDHAFLLLTGEGLQMVETDFTWPESGYGSGLIDVIGVGLGDRPGAVRLTYDLRPPLEAQLETQEPTAPTAERILTARCHNNSSRLREIKLRIESPDDGWSLTPAQWRTLDVPAGGTAEIEFRVRAPEGVLRMAEMKLVGEAGTDHIEATTTALYGGPTALETNLARAEGVEVSVDSSYQGGYSAEPLNDGLLWPTNVHWTKHAWASMELAHDHWIRFEWPEPVQVGRVIIYWNVEGGRVHTAQQLLIEVQKEGRWMPLAEAEPHSGDAATTIKLSPTRTDALRIIQPEGMGSEHRPNLMWVTEVQVGR